MAISEMAQKILEERYFVPGESTWTALCYRVAKYISFGGDGTGEDHDAYVSMLNNQDFIPNSPCLMNAGTAHPMLFACFVIPIEDSIESIFDAIKTTALVQRRGGGTGFTFGKLRGRGSRVSSTGGESSGAVSFLKVFSSATEAISQGGSRRGANMGVLPFNHPDIDEFVTVKSVEGTLKNFNLSVMVNDAEMELLHTNYSNGTGTDNPTWTKIIDGMWQNGEPGVLFYDTINEHNPTPHIGTLEASNPCGEALLLNYESCVLGSINLTKFVLPSDGYFDIDWYRLAEVARTATRFLDRCIDLNEYPMPEIEEATKRTRKIGLGVMGFADMLLMLDMNYDGIAARALGGRIMKTISEAADEESAALARKFGTYPACTPQYMRDIPMRNAVRTTIAPTGTISILAGVSWGIEPISSYSYLRKNCAGMEFMVGHPILEERLEECGLHKDTIARLMDRCYEKGSLQNIDIALPRSILDVFVTATDIAAIDHIKMQAVFQEHTDNAISKTIICPEETTREQIADIVYNAWDLGCKGLTVYRNNSRSDVVVNLKKPAITDTDIKVSRSTDTPVADTHVAKSSDSVGNIEHSHRRPRKLYGCTYKIHSGCGNLYVVTNLGVDGKVRESFVFTGGNGGCASLNEALGRSTSQGLWNGVDVDNYVRQFCKVKCAAAIKNPKAEGKSCADIMGKCLAETHKDDLLRQFALGELSPDSEFYKRMNLQKMVPLTALHSPESNKPRCIECDSPVVQTGQCYTCQSCGFSKCG